VNDLPVNRTELEKRAKLSGIDVNELYRRLESLSREDIIRIAYDLD
jgi:hypothetical protein